MHNEIRFIQYLQPDGRPRPTWIERSQEVARRARTLRHLGYKFEIEILRTGEVNIAISDGHCDVVGRVVENGPDVLEAVDWVVNELWKEVSLWETDDKS